MLHISQPPRAPKTTSGAGPANHAPPPHPAPPPPALPSRRASLVAGLAVLTSAAAWTLTPRPARADAPAAASFALAESAGEGAAAKGGSPAAAGGAASAAGPADAGAPYASVYFGSGCFWGRQKDFVDLERDLGRSPSQVSSLAGYAGGVVNDGTPACYYYVPPTDRAKVYERQGHAEVVSFDLAPFGGGRAVAEAEFARAAAIFFGRQFKAVQVRGGRGSMAMGRLDPQDAGPGYRPCVGLPGGVDSPLFPLLTAANVHGMTLTPGAGNSLAGGKASEGDVLGTVWVYDSTALPFHRAEAWHQMHAGLEGSFPRSYLVDQKRASVAAGKAVPVPGCPELPF